MPVPTLIAGIGLIVAALIVRRWRFEQYAWLIASAAVLVLLPAVGDKSWWWVALVIIAIVAWPVPSPADITLARGFFVLVLVLGLIGLILHASGINIPLEWTGRVVHFHWPIKEIVFQHVVTLDPHTVPTPTPTASSQVRAVATIVPQVSTFTVTPPPASPVVTPSVILVG